MMRTSHVFRFSVTGLRKRKLKGCISSNTNYEIILRGEQVVLEDNKNYKVSPLHAMEAYRKEEV